MPGEYEIRVGLHGAVDGMQFASGIHGRLRVSAKHRPLETLTAVALALTLAKVPAKARAELVKQLAKLAKTADLDSVELLPEARKILQRLKKATGVEWADTPTYKPRG